MTVNLGTLLKFWEEQAGLEAIAIQSAEKRLAEAQQANAHAIELIRAIRVAITAAETMRQMEQGDD